MTTLKKEEYTITQTRNNHLAVYKNKKMIFHANLEKKLSDEKLKNILNSFVNQNAFK